MKELKPLYNGNPESLDGKRVSKTELEQLRNLAGKDRIIIKLPVGYQGNSGLLRLLGVGLDLSTEKKTSPCMVPTYTLSGLESQSETIYEVNDVAMERFERQQKAAKLKSLRQRAERLQNLKERVLELYQKEGSQGNPFGDSLEEKREILKKLGKSKTADSKEGKKYGTLMPANYELRGTGDIPFSPTRARPYTPNLDSSTFGSLAAMSVKTNPKK